MDLTPLHSNFAADMHPDAWKEYANVHIIQKNPMPAPTVFTLKNYIANGDENKLANSTFRYIVEFIKTNTISQPARFEVACIDFGYTLAELCAIRDSGKTSFDIATEIINRTANKGEKNHLSPLHAVSGPLPIKEASAESSLRHSASIKPTLTRSISIHPNF